VDLSKLKLKLKDVLQIIKQVAEALDFAHRQGVIHRDIKPQNIMVDRQLRPYIMDFGIAKQLKAPRYTVTGYILGTPAFMSPQQAQSKQLDHRTDVYSLGVVLYNVLTDNLPFEDENMVSLLNKIIEHDPPPPRAFSKAIPVDVETIILRAMDKEPSRRYQTAKDLADDIGRFLSGEPILAKRTLVFYKVAKKIKKHPVVFILGIVIAILLFAIVTVIIAKEIQFVKRAKAIQEAHRIISEIRK
jgi:serine/threonine-protein kinase